MTRRGQTLLEYIILIGFIVLAMYYMAPAFKRGTQSLIKATADQIGNQAESDQTIKRYQTPDGKPMLAKDGEDDSFLVSTFSNSNVTGNRLSRDRLGVYDVQIQEEATSYSNSVTDQGFTKSN